MDDTPRREPSFSLHEFRSWLSKQDRLKVKKKKAKNDVSEGLIGRMVEPRLGVTRLEQKIAESNKTDVADILAERFKECGGRITAVSELDVTIEVEGRTFNLPKMYTKDMEV